MAIELDDPREFPLQADAGQVPPLALALESLAAPSAARADELDVALTATLAQNLRDGNGAQLESLFEAAPSAAAARHLWRRLIAAWTDASRGQADEPLAATVFALPIVIVAGITDDGGARDISAVLDDTARIATILREHVALAGNQTFGFANALAAANFFTLAQLPEVAGWQRIAATPGAMDRDVTPTVIAVTPGPESVHLRFLIGTAVAAPRANLLSGANVGAWGIPLAKEIGRQLTRPGVSVLVLPRAPQAPPAALVAGLAAQREVGVQIFASNAIRRMRGSVGEPSAVISAHRCPGAPGGGELRLSLSSPFDPRAAEGFRCPLYPTDRVADVTTMLVDLLRDCRVTDVQLLGGVHPDRDAATGMTLLFKADALPGAKQISMH